MKGKNCDCMMILFVGLQHNTNKQYRVSGKMNKLHIKPLPAFLLDFLHDVFISFMFSVL